MSGPALKQWDSHSSIHDAALREAEELTVLLRRCLEQQEIDKAFEVANIAVEHWETRTLQHAEAEEDGLYKEIIQSNPAAKEDIIALIRDHNLMRYLVDDIKDILIRKGVGRSVLHRLQALIEVDSLHNREEEKVVKHNV